MDALIPWDELEAEIAPFYPRRGQGRPPYPLAVMLRVHCLQLFYHRSDPGWEDDLYEIESRRRFAGLRLGGAIPEETTILNFRHLRERHGLGEILRSRINQQLAARGLRLREGTVVDSTLIAAPSSTQHEQKARDPEMHQTRKGKKNWYFGLQLHIGACLVWGDAGYQGIHKRPEHQDRDVHWHVALRPGVRRTLDPDSPAARVERAKSSLRAKVEHPFRTVKRHFGYDKVRYRGQHKHRQRLALLLGFHNLLRAAPCLAA